jgi:hypothetical protein
MVICFRIGDVEHCFYLPVVEWPPWGPHGPGPINYPALIQDATLVATAQNLAARVEDQGVREALLAGARTALKAVQARAGDHVRIGNQINPER